jgi:hypothetical protein
VPNTRRALVAAIALSLAVAVVPIAQAHQGNPNFRSTVRAVRPAVEGVDAQVVNFDDSIELRNRTGQTLIVKGYRGEPYVRITADGAVSVNRRSPSRYLNDDRFTEGVEIPAEADSKAAPVWEPVDRTGTYRWHDHRIHWMARSLPPQVKDEGKRTKVFDWRVPIAVGGRPAAIAGTLTWVGKQGGGFPLAAAIAFVVIVLAGLMLVLVVRRRRGPPSPPVEAVKEVW